MTKKLILFTSGYPYGSSEPFLETEVDYLSQAFEEVIIYCPYQPNSISRKLPLNCVVKTYQIDLSRIERLKAISGIFSKLFWQESKIIKSVYTKRLTVGILKTMLISIAKSRRIEKLCLMESQLNDRRDKLVFYSYWCDDTALGLALFRHKNQEYKCFSRMHGWDVYFEVSNVNYLPFRHYIADNLTALFPISQKGKDYILETWKITDSSKIHVSRLGVKKQEFVSNTFPFFTMVSCSNMIPLKRIHLIVDALSGIRDVQIQWFHFGDGPLMNEIMLIAKKSLPENVQANFMGRLNNQELMEWYSTHQPNVFINVSSSEGIPVSIMEAMAFGIPSIATDVGGTAELVNDKNGVLLQANPIKIDIKKAILFFLFMAKEQNHLFSNNAFDQWCENFNSEKNYKEFCSMLSAFD
ncbi:MAG: hypothetical protein RLZ33_1465 [Bacteroidota bacterium]|jgi:glycosyltransferase involved in cell wall biosynthesis